jgi:hypothetical protein
MNLDSSTMESGSDIRADCTGAKNSNSHGRLRSCVDSVFSIPYEHLRSTVSRRHENAWYGAL